MKNPKQGEIWTIRLEDINPFDQPIQSAVVLSIPALRSLPFRIIVPVTSFVDDHIEFAWLVPIHSVRDKFFQDGVTADAKRCFSISTDRFLKRVCMITVDELQQVRDAVAMCLGIVPV